MLSRFSFLFILFCSLSAIAHPGHGGGTSVSIEDDDSGLYHMHLPVHMTLDGQLTWGFGHDHGDHDDDHGDHDDDHGDHDDDHGDHDDDHGDHDDDHGDKKTELNIAPIIFADGDKIKRIVVAKKADENMVQDELLMADDVSEYYLLENRRLTGGLGVNLHLEFIDQFVLPPFIGAGFAAIKGRALYSKRLYNNKNEMNAAKKVEVPTSLQDLKKFAIDDVVTFTTMGGVVYSAGPGLEPLHVSALKSAVGKWKIRIKKVLETDVIVSITSQELKSVALEAAGIFTTVSVEKFKNDDEGFSFQIRLDEEDGLNAYRQLLAGNLVTAQRLAASPDSSNSVFVLKNSDAKSKGVSKSVQVGVAFLFGISNSKTQAFSLSNEINHEEELKGKNYSHAVVSQKKSKGLLSQHKLEVEAFVANYQDYWHIDHADINYGASYKWVYERDSLSDDSVKSKIFKTLKKLGLSDEAIPHIPEMDFGYLRTEIDIRFSNLLTDELMALTQSSTMALKDKALELFEKSFTSGDYDKRACRAQGNQSARRSSIVLLKDCKKKLKARLLDRMDALKESLSELKSSFASKDYEKFVTAYGKVGGHLMGNTNIFKSFLDSFKGVNISLGFKGETVLDQKFVLRKN